MRTNERPATVHDVARQAGVSAQTVSRLLRGYEGIRPVTREKVEAAIADLGYRPNGAARLLRTRRSTRIGVVVHEMFAYGPAGLLRGAARRAREAGYILNIVGVDGEDERAVSEAFDAFEAERVAAILAVTLTDSVRNAVEQRSSDVPILVDPAEAHQRSGYMNEVGGSLVARHFADLGHRRVGMVLGPQNWLPARQRRQGFVATAEDAGLECVRFWDGDWSAEAGAAAAAQFDPSDGITAVFAANDAQAIGFIGGLSQAGFRVPDDVSVAGFDGTPESAYFTPSLTTIGADYEGQGRIAIDALLASIQGESTELPSPDVTLVARASTASPATALKEPNES